jgi:hypothetical protein
VQVQSRNAELGCDRDRLFGGPEELVGAVGVGEVAGDVAGHGGEGGARAREGVDVFDGPVPDFDLEAELVDAADPLEDRKVGEDHLSADGESERLGHYVTTGSSSV